MQLVDDPHVQPQQSFGFPLLPSVFLRHQR
ncbi:MAG: hypothetical protein JWP63_3316, partial [Candidatus Solibacter sp.]|nr:hypothetical protein [Candidatus Solibacter sp.]